MSDEMPDKIWAGRNEGYSMWAKEPVMNDDEALYHHDRVLQEVLDALKETAEYAKFFPAGKEDMIGKHTAINKARAILEKFGR